MSCCGVASWRWYEAGHSRAHSDAHTSTLSGTRAQTNILNHVSTDVHITSYHRQLRQASQPVSRAPNHQTFRDSGTTRVQARDVISRQLQTETRLLRLANQPPTSLQTTNPPNPSAPSGQPTANQSPDHQSTKPVNSVRPTNRQPVSRPPIHQTR